MCNDVCIDTTTQCCQENLSVGFHMCPGTQVCATDGAACQTSCPGECAGTGAATAVSEGATGGGAMWLCCCPSQPPPMPVPAAGTSTCGPATAPLTGSVCYSPSAGQCCADPSKALLGYTLNGKGCYAYPYCPLTIKWGSGATDTTQILGERRHPAQHGQRSKGSAARQRQQHSWGWGLQEAWQAQAVPQGSRAGPGAP